MAVEGEGKGLGGSTRPAGKKGRSKLLGAVGGNKGSRNEFGCSGFRGAVHDGSICSVRNYEA